MKKMSDVSQEELINYLLGELSSRQVKKLEKVLETDGELRAECDRLQELLAETKEFLKNKEEGWSLGRSRHQQILEEAKSTKRFDLSLFFPLVFSRTRMFECMIVLVFLGGFIGSLITVVMGRLKSSRIKQTKIAMAEVGKALDMFYTDCGFYPSEEQGLRALVEPPSDGPSCAAWGPAPYIKKIPNDPWNHEYIYESEGKTYVLKSKGKDGITGGTGENEDISSENL